MEGGVNEKIGESIILPGGAKPHINTQFPSRQNSLFAELSKMILNTTDTLPILAILTLSLAVPRHFT